MNCDDIFGGEGRSSKISQTTIRIQEYFRGFFVYNCNFYRQPRTKRENHQRRFELCECFLVIIIIILVVVVVVVVVAVVVVIFRK